jgi:hypothetical protein
MCKYFSKKATSPLYLLEFCGKIVEIEQSAKVHHYGRAAQSKTPPKPFALGV